VSRPAIESEYRHYPKRASFVGMVADIRAELKFYHIEQSGAPIPTAISSDALAFVAETAVAGSDDTGFVILHRCGADFYFLLVSAWRGSNELWEAVHYRQGAMTTFAPFAPAYVEAGAPRPTFCLWELGVVAHEAAAWARLLAAPRGEDERVRWRATTFSGLV